MNETINNLITRRSVRSFQKEQISEEQLNEILTAGTYAASGMGRQSAIMVVIQNPEIIKRLSKLNAAIMDSENDPFYGAPTVVVVLGDWNIFRRWCVSNGESFKCSQCSWRRFLLDSSCQRSFYEY